MSKTHFSAWYLRFLALIFLAVSIGDQVNAQQRVDPAVRARLDREFAESHPQPGDYLPYLDLHKLNRTPSKSKATDEPTTENLRYASHGDLTLVLTASLTCPKTRQHLPAIQELKSKFESALQAFPFQLQSTTGAFDPGRGCANPSGFKQMPEGNHARRASISSRSGNSK